MMNIYVIAVLHDTLHTITLQNVTYRKSRLKSSILFERLMTRIETSNRWKKTVDPIYLPTDALSIFYHGGNGFSFLPYYYVTMLIWSNKFPSIDATNPPSLYGENKLTHFVIYDVGSDLCRLYIHHKDLYFHEGMLMYMLRFVPWFLVNDSFVLWLMKVYNRDHGGVDK